MASASVHFPTCLSRALKAKVHKEYWKGTHRAVPPGVTLAKITPLMSKFGITRIANVTGLDWLGIPVTMVCRPNSRSLSVSQGKGLTVEAAKASGLMEAIELYHAERISLPVKVGSFHDMSKRHNLVEIHRLPLVNHSRFHEHRELLWIEGHDLLNDQPTWVPYECVSNNAVTLNLPGQECFGMTSNGLASGNHVLEAILHGICEVVERDATTLWYCRKAQFRKTRYLSFDGCEDQTCRDLIARFHSLNVQMSVWDTTSEIGLPCFLCLLHEGDRDPSRLRYSSIGMGCHLVRGIALLRAITESAQSRLTLIAGSRDDIFRNQYELSRLPEEDLSLYRSLRSVNGQSLRFDTVPSFEHNTFNQDLELVLNRLKSSGLKQVIVVVLTEIDSPFQVVKVIIPGLEALDDHPRYYPGLRAQQCRNRPT